MFIGHMAVGFASKKAVPQTSLGWLLAAPMFLDLLWPMFLVLGIEKVRIDPGNTEFTPLDLHDYPYSHSLATALAWSVLFGGTYWLLHKDKRAALVLAAGVFSHWICDFITHRPDMPLYPGSAMSVGLGLWHSKIGTVLVEGAMFAGGVWLYAVTTKAVNRRGTLAWWGLVLFLVALYASVVLGPPPPNVMAIEIGAFASWLFVLWAWWIDRNRVTRDAQPG